MEPTNTAQRRADLRRLCGKLPDSNAPVHCRLESSEDYPTHRLERLTLNLNGIEDVPAYFVRPHGDGPFPLVLYNHAHGGDYVLGKDELTAGRYHLQSPPYGQLLPELGFAALCIDTWAFGERRGRSESEIFKEMLWHGQVMWGMMVYDNLRALDYALSRDDVDPERVATLGLSMGSTMAWWSAALDTRIKVCIDICCLTDFDAIIASRGLDGHGIYYFVPNLLNEFSCAEINALIAPRPHLSLNGNYDRLTPPEGLQRIDAELKKVYTDLDAAEAWSLKTYDTGHLETAAMRTEIVAFLKRWL